MRTFITTCAALAALAVPLSARAQSLDLSPWLQLAQQTAQSTTQCPPVEIAPGISVPVPCVSALPKIPTSAPAVEPLPVLVPPAIDLRAMGRDGPVKDQAQTGVCWAFAMTTVMESELRRQGRGDVLSPLHAVAAHAWDKLWSGQPSEAITTEQVWPYDPRKACKFERGPDNCERAYGLRTGTWQSEPALVAERERARLYGVATYGKARAFPHKNTAQIAASLAQGRAVYASMNIDSFAWGFRGVSGGVIAEYLSADRGGHGVALVGYRTVGWQRQFLVHNSWGAQWGDHGYAWISEASLQRHLIDALRIDAAPVQAGPVIFAPPSPSAPATCPSGLPAFMGQCWLG